MSEHKTELPFQCLLVINDNDASPSPSLFPNFLKKQIKNNENTYRELAEVYPFVTDVIFRSNNGMDIGAYDTGLQYLKEQNYDGDVILMNSSVSPPKQQYWLEKYNRLFHETPNTGACGITLNSHNTCLKPPLFMPHIQSFFIYSTMKVISHVFPKGIYTEKDETLLSEGKDNLVAKYEIGISQAMLEAGYGIRSSAFPDFLYFKGEQWSIPEGDIRFKKEYRALVNQM